MSSAGMDIQLHSRDHLDMRNRPMTGWCFKSSVGVNPSKGTQASQ
jgi:hypothetical protein